MRENSEIIDTYSRLESLCNEILLLKPKYLAIDTEFTRKKGQFYPKISLIQMSFNNRLFIIDCLSNGIDSFAPIDLIFKNNKIIKLFFDCSQDIVALSHITKFVPTPMIDVQTQAMFLSNYGNNVSYLFLLQKYLDITISKSEKNSNWGKRPLSNAQLDYAAVDVKYLIQLYNIIEDSLKCSNKLKFAKNENIFLADIYIRKSDHYKNQSFINRIFFLLKDNYPLLSQIQCYILSNQIENYILSPECVDQLSIIKSIVDDNGLDMVHIHALIDTEFADILSSNYRFEQKKSNEIYKFVLLYIQHKCISHNISYKVAIGKKHYLNNLINYNSRLNPIINGWRRKFFGNKVSIFLNGKKSLNISMMLGIKK